MGYRLGVYDGVRFPYEVFRDADYAKSGEVVVRQLTDEERSLYMSTTADKLQEADLLGSESASVLAKRYGVSASTIRRARVKLKAAMAEASNSDTAVAEEEEVSYAEGGNSYTASVEAGVPDEAISDDIMSCWDYLSQRLKDKQDFVVRVLGNNLYEPVDWELQRAIDVLLAE